MGFEQHLHLIGQWLVNHGFQLSNREWASLAWLVLLTIVALFGSVISPEFRHDLAGIFKTAFLSELLYLWIVYAVWIGLFVYLADHVGYWRPMMTRATLVWAATAGLRTLGGFIDVDSLGYIKTAIQNQIQGIIIFEYIIGFASFSIIIEFILQLFIFIALVAPVVESDLRDLWTRVGLGFFICLIVAMIINSGLAATDRWTTLDWELILRQIALPVLLGTWVILFVPVVAVFSAYQNVFRRMEIFRDDNEDSWKAKMGVVLALRHHLKYIREAEKGGAEITCAARADSVGAAYREARKLVDE